jgi:hypothetical protein
LTNDDFVSFLLPLQIIDPKFNANMEEDSEESTNKGPHITIIKGGKARWVLGLGLV